MLVHTIYADLSKRQNSEIFIALITKTYFENKAEILKKDTHFFFWRKKKTKKSEEHKSETQTLDST